MLNQNFIKNQKGIAVFESIPIILVMILLLNFSIGFFGVVHTGILNSIASRNYAFETFRHRADNKYFRSKSELPYNKKGFRFHGTVSELTKQDDNRFVATSRPIDFFNLIHRGQLRRYPSVHAKELPVEDTAHGQEVEERDDPLIHVLGVFAQALGAEVEVGGHLTAFVVAA